MICSKCGNSIPKDDDFCPKCGHKITEAETNYEIGTVRASIINMAQSRVFCMAVICLMAFAVLSFLGWFIPLEPAKYAELLRSIGASESIAGIFDIEGISGKLQILFVLASFMISLPVLLTALGLCVFMTYARGGTKQTGLDIVKAGITVNIIYFSALGLGVLGGGVALVIFEAYGDPHSLMWTLPAFIIGIGIVIAAFILLLRMNTLIKTVKEAIENDDFSEPPSDYVIRASIGLGVFGLVCGTLIFVFVHDFITGLTILAWAVSQILIAKTIRSIQKIDTMIYDGVYDTVYNLPKTVSTGEYYEPKRYCMHCGRVLYGTEVCNCKPDTGGMKSTMPDDGCVSHGKHKKGNKYFKKSGNL